MGGGREKVRQLRRRKAWWSVQNGAAVRQPMDEQTQIDFLQAIDRNKTSAFGIEKLSRLDLDAPIGPVPNWIKSCGGEERVLPLLRYAALRGRHHVVAMLLRAGANLLPDPKHWLLDDNARRQVAALLSGENDDAGDAPVGDEAAADAGDGVNHRTSLADAREAAQILCSAARMLEFGGDGVMRWKWIEKTNRSQEWHGCGCVLERPLEVWQALAKRPLRETDTVACVACGAQGLPAPLKPLDDEDDGNECSIDAAESRAKYLLLDDEEKARRAQLLNEAVRRGQPSRIRKLIEKGVDLDLRDDFDATPLLVAAMRNDSATLAMLRQAGADAGLGTRSTPEGTLVYAQGILEHQQKHEAAQAAATSSEATDETAGENSRADEPSAVGSSSGPPCAVVPEAGFRESVVRELKAKNAYVVDYALTAAEMDSLLVLFASAAPSPQAAGRQCGIERRNFIDATRWLDAIVRRSLPSARVAPRCKFVHYVGPTAEMAPHVDLCKPTAEIVGHSEYLLKRKTLPSSTSHTWVIYLNTCTQGGGTAMLRDVRDRLSIVDVVLPKTGRLLVFPHRTPHAGQPVSPDDVNKLIVRGELLLLPMPAA